MRNGTVAENEYVDPTLDLAVTAFASDPGEFLDDLRVRIRRLESKFANMSPGSTHMDVRSGRMASLRPSYPVVPGNGFGNRLRYGTVGKRGSAGEWSGIAADAVREWLADNAADLDVDASELLAPGAVRSAVHGADGDLIQLGMSRTFNGVPVTGSRATATLKGGNLISIGFESWGTIPIRRVSQLARRKIYFPRTAVQPYSRIAPR